MGQRITLSESEKRNILKMYHLVEWTSMDELTPVPKDEIKKYILHSTGVDPRILFNEGMDLKCSQDSELWSRYEYPCTIHAMNTYQDFWGFVIKGAVVIDTTRIPNHKWWFDPKFHNSRNENTPEGRMAIVTDERIPAEAIIGILCMRDLQDMMRFFKENPSDELTQQYLDEVMEKNSTDWSNDCQAKTEDFRIKHNLR
jgi:hypothetical protein